MKRYLVALLFLMVISGLSADNLMNVRFGFLAPEGAKTGIFGGLSYGSSFDEVVSMDMGFDYFYKGFKEKRKLYEWDTEAGNTEETFKQTSDIKTMYLPIMLALNIHIPLDHSVKPFFKAGLGWGFLWEDVYVAAIPEEEPNAHDEIDDTKFYNGFNWTLGAGAKYKLGSKSHVYGEFFYNGGRMKRDIKKSEYGITWDEINMSGVGMRLGIEFRIR